MTLRLTMAQALVRYLQAQYTERDGERRRLIPAMLGIFGHGNVCGIGQAVSAEGFRFLQPRHEQAMVHSALGYAKASRRLSTLACTASIGPGATNLVTGAATATINRLPVLLLAGDTFANRRQGVVLQQLEHPSYADWSVNECLRPVSRFFDRIARPEQLLTGLPEAMRVLTDPAETGAVTLALHQDVQGEAYEYPATFFAERTWHVPRRPPERDELAAAVRVLSEARRPIVIAGGGVWHSGAEGELATMVEEFGMPVCETSAGKGTCRAGLGGIGVNGTGAANALAADADVVLCVGTRLSDFTTASRSLFQDPDVRFVGLNVCGSDAHKVGAFPLVADARAGLEALTRALSGWRGSSGRRKQAARLLEVWRTDVSADLRPRDGEGLTAGQVLRTLNTHARARDWVVAAAGSPPGDLLKLWETTEEVRLHLEFGFSCMGHELPAGLGIRMAEPDVGEIFVVIGDGTFLMAPSELVTAVQEDLKVTVVLLVNGGYQSIHGLQRQTGCPGLGTEFRDIEYIACARSMGCEAMAATTAAEFHAALEEARSSSRTTVIACHVEPHRAVLGSGAFWDLGVAENGPAAYDAIEEGRARQRFYAWRGA